MIKKSGASAFSRTAKLARPFSAPNREKDLPEKVCRIRRLPLARHTGIAPLNTGIAELKKPRKVAPRGFPLLVLRLLPVKRGTEEGGSALLSVFRSKTQSSRFLLNDRGGPAVNRPRPPRFPRKGGGSWLWLLL